VRVALLSRGGNDGVRRARAAGADLVCLPQLSFLPYLPAVLDRAGLERAERPPARSYGEALSEFGITDEAVVAAAQRSLARLEA